MRELLSYVPFRSDRTRARPSLHAVSELHGLARSGDPATPVVSVYSTSNTCETSIPSWRFRYFAISRLDQCDKPVCSGALFLLSARIRERTRSSCVLGLPGCGIPHSPSIPDSAYRTGHNRTVLSVTPAQCAI